MRVPWQTDEASCLSGYDTSTYLPLPTFWAARVPNHVLSEQAYRRAIDERLPPAQRLKHFDYRQFWLRDLGVSYQARINEMVAKWHELGIVAAQAGPPDWARVNMPQTVWVEMERAALYSSNDPTWHQVLVAERVVDAPAEAQPAEAARLLAGEGAARATASPSPLWPRRSVTVAIVGGSPAGASVAITLARHGLHALVLEAAPAAQAKIGECLPPASGLVLRQLGLESALTAEGHVRSHGNRSSWGSDAAVDQDFLFGVHGPGWHLSRHAFEALLARTAIANGVKWRYGATVTTAKRRSDSWVVSVVDGNGRREAIDAEFVVDASGRRSTVARRLGACRVAYDHLVGAAALLEPCGAGIADTYALVEAARSGW